MKRLTHIRQETPFWCGPACLKAIYEYLIPFPIKYSQQVWAVRANTTQAKGTGPAGLKKAVSLFATFEVHKKRTVPFANGTCGIVYDRKRDHWLAFLSLATSVQLMDPEYGNETVLNHKEFLAKYMNSKRNSYALSVLE